jgi:hypothetical protein
LYSFTKEERKPGIMNDICQLDKYYDLKSTVAMSNYDLKKTPGFGIGVRASMKEMSLEALFNPGPGTYNT